MDVDEEAVRVGLVGAGPWARMVHGPMLANTPGLRLAAVWGRRPEAAAEVAAPSGAAVAGSVDELLEVCDAVAFAVPPDVQVDIGVRAAAAGKHLLLEKPIGLDLDGAHRLTDAVDEAGVASQVVLTWRYAAAVRSFLEEVAAADPLGGRGRFLSGALLGGPFATPWRLEHGCLLDLGPHVVDLLDAALGPVVEVRAAGDPLRWVGLLLEHESGVTSEASLSASTAVQPPRAGVEVLCAGGAIDIDTTAAVGVEAVGTVAAEFATTARGTPHPLDVHRALHLQRVLESAAADLA